MEITTDSLKQLPHIVILKSESDIKVIEFTGHDAMHRAHEEAMKLASTWDGCITVAARVRQMCPIRLSHLMS